MLGSALSGLAMNFWFLVFARAIQGVGMGVLMPLSQTILGDLIPARQRGKYQGYMGAVMGASQVAGPLVGGWITDVSSWRWLFYIGLPVGLVALVMIIRFLDIPELDVPAKIDSGIGDDRHRHPARHQLGGTTGWLHPQVLALSSAGLLTAFGWSSCGRTNRHPDAVFGNSVFTWSTVSAFAMNMAVMAVVIYVPVYARCAGRQRHRSGLI